MATPPPNNPIGLDTLKALGAVPWLNTNRGLNAAGQGKSGRR